MKTVNRHQIALSLLVAMTLTDLPLAADEPNHVTDSIQILSAYAEPAPAGACTEIRFQLRNDGRHDLQIIGLDTDIASSARLIAKVGARQTVALDSFGVPAEEIVDFTHARWFELCGLTRPLQTGEDVMVGVRTVLWSTALWVHVH